MPINFSSEQTDKIEKSNQTAAVEKKVALEEKINNFLLRFSRVPADELLFFVQHLGIMLKAGVSILTALQTLAKQSENKKFIKILNETASNIEKGKTLTESLKLNENIFGELFINMVEAGELSGKLENVLGQLYIQMKKQHELISKVKGALTYPLVVMFAMGGIGLFMMVSVIPKLTQMLKDFNTELPLATKILLSVSDFLVLHGILSIVIAATAIISGYKILKTKKGKFYFQAALLKAPIFSPIIKKINLAKFSRTISSLLKTDMMIIKSFQITANVLGNLHYRGAIEEIAEKIKKGTPINEVIANYPKLFPPLVIQMVAIGEQTGELDSILEELASFYEEEIDQIMQNLPSIIEPLLILVMGSAVGAMAVAIIMPMYSITNNI